MITVIKVSYGGCLVSFCKSCCKFITEVAFDFHREAVSFDYSLDCQNDITSKD